MITVRNRELIIPKSEVYIGTIDDNNSENRQFRIERYINNGIDLAALSFHLDLENQNGQKNASILVKEVLDDFIILTWGIIKNDVSVSGTLFVNIRATDYQGTVKWNSFKAAFYVEPVIGTAEGYTGSLSEMEQMEIRIDKKTETLDSNEEIRQTQEAERQRTSSAAVSAANNAKDRANSAAVGVEAAILRVNDAAVGVEDAIDRANSSASRTDAAISGAEAATTAANTAKTGANTARDAANTAASNANSKATEASTAAANANGKATLANTAASNADTKASAANSAAVAATNAANAANTAKTNTEAATTAANTAASNANSKATLANTAASNADAKASAANTAKINAEAATTAANSAATNANGKATLANTAATYANTQGDYAKEQGDAVSVIIDGSNLVLKNGGDASSTVVSAFQSSTASFPLPAAGDSLKVLFGKLLKSMTDWINLKSSILLKSMVVNNFSTTAEGTVADGRALKTAWDKITGVETLANQVNSDLAYFKNGYISSGAGITPDSSMLSGLQEIYAGLPDNRVYEILASFSGAMVHLSGLKVNIQYGYIVSRSYAEAANKRYDITNGVWTANAK